MFHFLDWPLLLVSFNLSCSLNSVFLLTLFFHFFLLIGVSSIWFFYLFLLFLVSILPFHFPLQKVFSLFSSLILLIIHIACCIFLSILLSVLYLLIVWYHLFFGVLWFSLMSLWFVVCTLSSSSCCLLWVCISFSSALFWWLHLLSLPFYSYTILFYDLILFLLQILNIHFCVFLSYICKDPIN